MNLFNKDYLSKSKAPISKLALVSAMTSVLEGAVNSSLIGDLDLRGDLLSGETYLLGDLGDLN